MLAKRSVCNCRWSEPTLFLPMPHWCEAWGYPWACQWEDEPHVLHDVGACSECPRWEPRAGTRAARRSDHPTAGVSAT